MKGEVLNFFAIVRIDENIAINRINTNQEVQEKLLGVFLRAYGSFLDDDTEEVEFSGTYRPEEEELLYIDPYEPPDEFVEAISNPAGVAPLVMESNQIPPIKAIFTGWEDKEGVHILYQLFKKNQFLTRSGISLILSNDTFRHLSDPGIVISYEITAYQRGSRLLFNSFTQLRQIFDMSQHYREATDSDITNFVANDNVHVEDEESFRENSDTWVRRKLALISDREILQNVAPTQIREAATEYNLDIQIREVNGKDCISMPAVKKELKNLLRFLDEDYFSGPISAEKYLSNSKRNL